MALFAFFARRPAHLLSIVITSAAALLGQPARITQAIDSGNVVPLPGLVSPRAMAQYDRGPVPASFPMRYVSLQLAASSAQQAALRQLLSSQQDPSSPSFRQWITPEEYADRFGLNSTDMAKIASWLEAEGFTVEYQAHGRNWIVFSGDAARIEQAFHTEIHRFQVGSEEHFANVTNPSIPAALAGIVSNIRGLHDFRLRPAHIKGKSIPSRAVRPNYSDPYGDHYLAPDDLATIYDINPYYSAGFSGSNQSLVIVGQTDYYSSDISTYRSSFNLPAGNIQKILFGTDPGITSDVDEAELDLEISGAVARNATIYFVYSTDVFTSAQYAIDNNYAPVISMSYGGCEQENSGGLSAGESLAQQANSLGITWLASSGDSGAAACDASSESQANQGLAVNFPASIPEVTAVGGTEFNENGGSYWGATNGANGGSAFAYIPEMGWNDSSDGTGLDTALASTGGGKSIFFPTPTWQSGSGFPNNGKRDVPDISMAASADHDGYLVCIHPDCPNYYDIFGGTSASTPLMAGVLALVNQYLVASGTQSHAGLGNINPALYSIYQTNHNVFHDVTAGSNIVPCQIGTTNCSTGSMGYSAGHGYDLVTGLGSVDAYNLVTAWAQPQGTTLSVASSHTGSFTQGQTGATYTVTVSNKGTGSTSGTVTLAETIPSGLTLVSMTGSGWTCNSNTCTNSGVLAGGASYSAVTVTVNVALTAPGQVTNSVKVSGGNSDRPRPPTQRRFCRSWPAT